MFDEYLQLHPLHALLASRGERIPFPAAADRAAWARVSPAARDEILAAADAFLGAGYPMLTATQFLAFVRDGSRQAYERPYFERRRHLLCCALAECLTREGRYLDDVVDGLFCICEETFWGISAHNGSDHPGMRPQKERPLPDAKNPYIDLFAAQTASTVAWVCFLLRDALDGVSPLLVRRAQDETERRIFEPFMYRDDFWWMGMIRSDVNNWTPWIVSNVMDAMRLWETDDRRLAEGLSRGLRMLDSYLRVMPPDGGCDEGAGYWNMAGGALLCCLEHVMDATGGRVSFFDDAHIHAIGAFPLRAHIAGPYYLNFADCDARPMLDGERVYRYGEYTKDEALRALGAQIAHEDPRVLPVDTPETYRVLCKLFRPVGEAKPPEAKADVCLPDLQVWAGRRGGLFGAMKGGHNAENHNHNDVGAFLLYVDGEPAVVDVGNMVYTAKTFGPERYTLFNTRSRNHNLPLIGEYEQAAGRTHCARDVRFLQGGMEMDIAAAYPEEAGALRLHRRCTLTENAFTLTDAMELSSAQAVTWVFMLRQEPRVSKDVVAFGKLALSVPSGCDIQYEEIPVTDARMAGNFPGSFYRLTVRSAAAPRHEASFTFSRRP